MTLFSTPNPPDPGGGGALLLELLIWNLVGTEDTRVSHALSREGLALSVLYERMSLREVP